MSAKKKMTRAGSLSLDSPASDHFRLPAPVMSLVGKTEEVLSSHLVVEYWPTLVKFLEWNLVWLLAYLGFGYGWLLFMVTVYHLNRSGSSFLGLEALAAGVKARAEKEVLTETFAALPSWVAFPYFDRMEWVNSILDQLW